MTTKRNKASNQSARDPVTEPHNIASESFGGHGRGGFDSEERLWYVLISVIFPWNSSGKLMNN